MTTPEHLRGNLAERLCELGIACLYHLHDIGGWPRALAEIKAVAHDLELRLADDGCRREEGLAVDLIDRQWVAVLARVERGPYGNECHVAEAAPAKVSDSIVLALAGKLHTDADLDDAEQAACPHGDPECLGGADGLHIACEKPSRPSPYHPGYLDGP